MDLGALHAYCLSRQGATEALPFGEDVLVFKVAGKIFALVNLRRLPLSINLKCDPERAVALRERYAAVEPGYHMNKTHWNTIHFDGTIPDVEVRALIDHSYDRVVAGLKKAERRALADL